jgi:hypothetical protein
MLVVLTLYFAVATELRFRSFARALSLGDSTAQVRPAVIPQPANGTSDEFAVRTRLEEEVIQRRYQEANTLILSRAWTRYMGFMIGMILCVVGAVFVLGRLQDSGSKATAGAGEEKSLSLESASPGLFLALFGSVLLGLVISGSLDVNVKDSPVYLAPPGVPIAGVSGSGKTHLGDDSAIMQVVPHPPHH